MQKLGLLTAAAVIAAAMGIGGAAWADEFADSVVSFTPVTSGTAVDATAIDTTGDSDEPAEGGTDATGAPDAGNFNQFVALGIDEKSTADTADDDRGEIVLDFTDNLCVGVTGADIRIFETGDNETYTLEVALNDGSFSTPTAGSGDDDVDLTGVSDGDLFNRVRITATNFAGSTNFAGADIDAVECLESVNLDASVIEKELISGPNDRDGDPIAVDIDPFDDGGILVLSTESQRFEFKITITNDGENNEIDGLKIFDVVGAEFDPDPDAEDGTIDDFIDNPCPDTATCDGIDDTGGTGLCTATITPHDSGRKLDPHFILIVLDTLLAGETCVVTVWVKTDENPASARKTGEGDADPTGEPVTNAKEKFSPTSCDLVMEPDLFNTFTLNEGVKVFDPDLGIRLLGPVGSLQLTCNFPE